MKICFLGGFSSDKETEGILRWAEKEFRFSIKIFEAQMSCAKIM